MLAEVANFVPALTPLGAMCYGTRPADVFFRMDSGETRTIACSSAVEQGDLMGSAMFFLVLRPELKRFREEFKRVGVEAFAYMDEVSLSLMVVTANTVRAFAFLRRELEDIDIVVNPTNTMALPPKNHAPTAEEISLLESVDDRIVGEGGVTVVCVPIGTEKCALERAIEVVRDRGADRLALCLVTCRTSKRRPSSQSNPSGRRQTI